MIWDVTTLKDIKVIFIHESNYQHIVITERNISF